MARITQPLTRKIVRVHDAPPVFMAALPVATEQPAPKPIPVVPAARAARYIETAAGGTLAGLTATLLISALPAPDPGGLGGAAVAKSLLWLTAAGALAGGCIGGFLAASTDRGSRAAARGVMAGLWGLGVGGMASLVATSGALRLWTLLGWAGPVVAFPAGPVAMGPLAWVGVGTLWALLVGALLPLAPGRPGGSPGRAGLLAGLAGLAGSVTAALTGVVAPAVLLVAAAIGVAGRAERPL